MNYIFKLLTNRCIKQFPGKTLVSEHCEPAFRSEVIHAVDQPLLKIGQCYPNPLTPARFYVKCDK